MFQLRALTVGWFRSLLSCKGFFFPIATVTAVTLAGATLFGQTVVTTANMQGWSISSATGGTTTFVTDAAPQSGRGSIKLVTINDVASRTQIRRDVNVPLSTVYDLGYWSRTNSAPIAEAAPSFAIGVNLDGTPATFTNLIYEPYWSNGGNADPAPIVANTWQQWDVDAGTTFWSSATVNAGSCIVGAGSGGPPFYSLAAISAMCPSAVVVSHSIFMGTYNPNWNSSVDLVSFNGTTFDFEDTPSNGKIAFETNRDGNNEIYIMDADGSNQTRLTNNSAYDGEAAFSPDGTKILFHSFRDGNHELYTMNVDGTSQTRLTNTSDAESRPSFSPDGAKILFNRGSGNGTEIYLMDINGTNVVRLTNNSSFDNYPRFTADGSRITFHSNRHTSEAEIYIMNADGSNVARLTNNAVNDAEAVPSPDGSKILFFSNRTGNYEIWVMNINGSSPVNLSNSTVKSDASCTWSADGTRIVFVAFRDGSEEIYTMKADGTAQTRLTVNSSIDEYPAWQGVLHY